MTDVFERRHYYSNTDMIKQCELIKSVLSTTKEVKEGRGKKAVMVKKPLYPNDKDLLDKAIRSIEYYKKLHELEQSKVKFRDYQKQIIESGFDIIKKHGFLYLAMEVRTGKTLTSLGIADKLGVKSILFITKKKAISSIESDYNMLGPQYKIHITNYENLHNLDNELRFDLIVLDEAHGIGAFPKPSLRAGQVSRIIKKHRPYVILLSGTPTPESYSQMYHQVYGIPNNPFAEFKNFYRFCDKYVRVREKRVSGLVLRDYSNGLETILDAMKPYTISYTQKEAGFVSQIEEEVLEVEMKQSTYDLIARLKRDLVVEGKNEVILGDSSVKLMMKAHQLYSGTIKFESGNSMILDMSKAEFIKSHFATSKIGIFYKFKEELNALQQVYGNELTTDLDEFNNNDSKVIALQIVSGREGISLRKADYLVYYNIDFSATSYWQSKDRMTTMERLCNKVYWIFSKGGIEHDIYKAVTKKKDFTVKHFEKTLL
jgi:SNF2-related domain